MNKNRRDSTLPQKCYAILPNDGSLVIITQDVPGYTHSPLDQGDRQKNRAIADEKNRELGGVTPEQEEAMITGTIFGWEFVRMVEEDPTRLMSQIFRVEISRPGSFGEGTSSTLSLPATPYELLDALDKARVTDERVIYSTEIIDCRLNYPSQLSSPSTNLYELNHLAHRLSTLSEWELDCFEGMVMMDAVRTGYAPIPVDRLINMTYSTSDCHVVYEADNDALLGRFYADNGFVKELETLPERIFPWLDYGKIGKEMREGEGGVFTPNGYVVQNGEIEEVYQNGGAIPTQRPDYAVLLKVTKGFFNGPEYDNDLVTFLKLPTSDDELFRAVGEVEAASPEECAYSALDCIVPRLTEKISDALEETDGDCYGLVSELARQLQKLDSEGGIPKYKAMLEAASEDISLVEVLDLCRETERFSLMREMSSPSDYAAKEVQRLMSHENDEGLEKYFDLPEYGHYIMEKNGISETSYGLLEPLEGQTVEECLGRPEHHITLE